MSIADQVFGKPLATSEEHGEHIGVAAGLPIFGLDALTSAAYGPEAAMTLLIPLGIAGVYHIVPVISAILILLVIVYFSYLQTIKAYPNGGGSYTVANENLGRGAGLLAAAALMIDYILTAAVGISAGVTALTSAVPALHHHTLALCLVILAILAIVNLRGVKESGTAFIVPTSMFVGTLLAVIILGTYRTILSGGHPIPVAPPPRRGGSKIVAFHLRCASNASSLKAPSGPKYGFTAALQTRMSIAPKRPLAPATSASTSSRRDTLHGMTAASPPLSRMP